MTRGLRGNAVKNFITISWNLEDILTAATEHRNIPVHITVEEAEDVLYRIKENHDANEGINWAVIQLAIDDVIRERA